MPAVLAVREVCEAALRKVGTLSAYETAGDPREMQIAQEWLDHLIGHTTGAHRMPWLLARTVSFTPPAGLASFDLHDELAAGDLPHGVQYPVMATIREDTQDSVPLPLIRRREYEEIGNKTDEGRPEVLFIDRVPPKPRAYIWQVPVTAGTPVFTIDLVVQTFAPDLRGADTKNARVTTLPAAWNLWMITALANLIGSGPVIRLDRGEQRDIKKEAEEYLADLLSFANDEHADQPRNAQFNHPAGVGINTRATRLGRRPTFPR